MAHYKRTGLKNQTQQVLQTAKSKLCPTSMEDVRSEGGAAIWSCILVNSFEHFFKLELWMQKSTARFWSTMQWKAFTVDGFFLQEEWNVLQEE